MLPLSSRREGARLTPSFCQRPVPGPAHGGLEVWLTAEPRCSPRRPGPPARSAAQPTPLVAGPGRAPPGPGGCEAALARSPPRSAAATKPPPPTGLGGRRLPRAAGAHYDSQQAVRGRRAGPAAVRTGPCRSPPLFSARGSAACAQPRGAFKDPACFARRHNKDGGGRGAAVVGAARLRVPSLSAGAGLGSGGRGARAPPAPVPPARSAGPPLR